MIGQIRQAARDYGKSWSRTLRFAGRFHSLLRDAVLANICGAASAAMQMIIPLMSVRIFNEVLPHKDFLLLAKVAAIVGGAAICAILLGYAESYAASSFREKATVKLNIQLFETLQAQPFLFFKKHENGYLMSRIFNDASASLDVLNTITTLGRITISIVAALVMLPAFHISLGAAILALAPLYGCAFLWFHLRANQAFLEVSEKTAGASREMYESLSGIYEIKAYGAERYRARRYGRRTIDRARVILKARALMTAGEQTTQIITLLVTLSVMLWGGISIIWGKLSLGELIAINAMSAYILLPMNNIAQQMLRSQQSVAAIDRTEKWLALPGEMAGGKEYPATPVRGTIRYENVSFAYEDRPPVLRDLSFEISAGEVVLISGASGAGKTTLVHMLPRFLDPSNGSIYLDGRPLSNYPTDYLRRQIAFVSQDVFLFSESITYNIRMGDSSIGHEEIREAARIANALDFIEALPQGFDTQVGQRGTRLSGGQRQRIAIARAIAHKAPILVLDEATSAVDAGTEAAVHQALDRLMRGRTTIIIAHHSTAFADRINRAFFLQDGMLISASLPELQHVAVAGSEII
jgi:ABC-type multidrug transport system fused ATPase/permease subunit